MPSDQENEQASLVVARSLDGMAARVKPPVRSAAMGALAVTTRIVGLVKRLSSPSPQLGVAEPRSVILFRVDLLGDVVNSLPAATALKRHFPGVRVTFVCLPLAVELVSACPDVDRVIAVETNAIRSPNFLFRPRLWRGSVGSIRAIRDSHYDVALSLNGKTASLLALCARARLRIGFSDEAYPSSLDRVLAHGRMSLRRPQHDSMFTAQLLVARFGEGIGAEMHPSLRVTAAAEQKLERKLGQFDVLPDSKIVAVHAGSRYGSFKQWPAAHFVALIAALRARGFVVVMTGSKFEASVAKGIANDTGAMSLAGETDISLLLALLRRADLVVSGDTGPLHLAAALGTPVVGIFGPTDPRINGPRSWAGQPVAVLRRNISCSPCYSVRVRADCPMGDPICMRLVSVPSVLEKCLQTLEGAEGSRR